MNTNHEYTNSLINSTSPYLLQHAHNPVEWFDWSPETWEMANHLDKPVIVSIGYSSCHWCHVMEHESFEDVPTSEIMNRWFVNIKVDREERPDVDMVYMDACQLMTGRGGWPLNVICLPDKRPIFAGTYFPNESWTQVLLQIQALWKSDRKKAYAYAENLEKGLQEMSLVEKKGSDTFTRLDLETMYDALSANFDPDDGGPNRVPKFPMPNNYEYLLDHYLTTGQNEALQFTNLTLLKMANGGICDQIRGGFSRYSTDKYWFAPHFEKMLYDNAQLIGLYARAFSYTDLYQYKEVVKNTIHFCLHELKSPTGGFYSALDADTDGIEGKYYTFTAAELKSALNKADYGMAAYIFGCKEEGNWEHGLNILHWPHAIPKILQEKDMDIAKFNASFKRIQNKLLEIQLRRNRPGLDNKIITAWNGLMLEGLAKAALYMNNQTWKDEAQSLAEWMWNHLQCKGKLWRIFAGNKASIAAFAEDYACFVGGLIALFELDQNSKWIFYAETLSTTLINEFYDEENGIFWFTENTAEKLILRKTDLGDDVISSANSMMCIQLQKLGVLLDKNEWVNIGKKQLTSVKQQVKQHPGWYSYWARAAQIEAIGLLQIECTGPNALENVMMIQKTLPSWGIYCAAVNQSDLPIFNNKFKENKNQIFVCLGNTCYDPIENPENAIDLARDLLGFED